MPHTKAEMAEVAERRAKLIRLRRAGRDYEHIVKELGYSSRGAASKDLIRALEERRDEQAAEVSVYRQEENERLDALLEAVWAEAQAGELRAVETVLKLMDRRAKLLGLDAPVRTELSGPDGGAVPLGNGSLAELNKLIGIAGETGAGETGNVDDGEQDAGDDSDG